MFEIEIGMLEGDIEQRPPKGFPPPPNRVLVSGGKSFLEGGGGQVKS